MAEGCIKCGGKSLEPCWKCEQLDRLIFEATFEGWIKDLERQIENNRKSEILTADDFNIRINCKG